MTDIKSPAFNRGQHRRNATSADLLRCLGKYVQAAGILRQNLEMSSTYFISDRNSLSDRLRELGDYEGAIKIDEVTILARQQIDQEGEDTIATLQSLADNLSQVGKYQKAIPLYRSALATRIKTLGGKHEDTLATKHNLASSLYELGQV
ncbi:MAG: hypothetical protein Q9177_004277 [Variospora cf. flavescens]